jgi:hypothetical protein
MNFQSVVAAKPQNRPTCGSFEEIILVFGVNRVIYDSLSNLCRICPPSLYGSILRFNHLLCLKRIVRRHRNLHRRSTSGGSYLRLVHFLCHVVLAFPCFPRRYFGFTALGAGKFWVEACLGATEIFFAESRPSDGLRYVLSVLPMSETLPAFGPKATSRRSGCLRGGRKNRVALYPSSDYRPRLSIDDLLAAARFPWAREALS